MSLDAPAHATPPITSREELIAWYREGEKPVEQHRIGVETEKIGVIESTGEPVPLTGPQSIARLLEGLAEKTGGKLLIEHDVPIGVQLKDSSIALEPGGQLELSGAPVHNLADASAELDRHLADVRELSRPLGLAWLSIGFRPFGVRENVPWLPRGRYALMKQRLPGIYAHDMMQQTASVQANFDFSDETDLASKVSCATAVSPLISALYANSPLRDGKSAGVQSFRYYLWRDVDASRSGLLRIMYEPGFTYERYLDWALAIPLLFVRRRGEYRDPGGRTLADVIRDGFEGEPASHQDFVDLMSTVFPEIRVKKVLEVRGADAVDVPLTKAFPALWAGLLYDSRARKESRALVDMPFEELETLKQQIAVHGLNARRGTTRVQELARELVRISEGGLRRRFEAGTSQDERPMLEPVNAILQSGRTRADDLMRVFEKSGGDRASVIAAIRY